MIEDAAEALGGLTALVGAAVETGQALLERFVKEWGDYVRLAKIEPM